MTVQKRKDSVYRRRNGPHERPSFIYDCHIVTHTYYVYRESATYLCDSRCDSRVTVEETVTLARLAKSREHAPRHAPDPDRGLIRSICVRNEKSNRSNLLPIRALALEQRVLKIILTDDAQRIRLRFSNSGGELCPILWKGVSIRRLFRGPPFHRVEVRYEQSPFSAVVLHSSRNL